MLVNLSVPRSAVIPLLTYDDVAEASEWLCRAFGFKERLRIGDHRAQLVFGDGAVIITAGRTDRRVASNPVTHAVHVRVSDADRHVSTALSTSAVITGRSRNRSPTSTLSRGEQPRPTSSRNVLWITRWM